MKRNQVLLIVLVVLFAVSITTTLTIAQSPTESGAPAVAPGAEPSGQGVAATVGNYIPVQGRLTNASGIPASGAFTITFRLYSAVSGGVALCQDANSVSVNNGLFSSEILGNCQDEMDGQQLYLGIEVGSDGEMAPRQPIYAVPYAWSLRPGAVISGSVSNGEILELANSAYEGSGLAAYAMNPTGVNSGVIGASRSPNGFGGVFYNSGGGAGLRADSNTGAALSATGSGIIWSTAKTIISVSALKALVSAGSIGEVQFRSNGANMEIRPVVSGTHTVHIPVDLPSKLFGVTTKIESLQVCYQCQTAESYVDTTIMSQGTGWGVISAMFSDTTNRTSTIGECYTVNDGFPNEVLGSVWIQLSLRFAGTGSLHDIRIGNIALTLTEQ
jgi:hypothetical protein